MKNRLKLAIVGVLGFLASGGMMLQATEYSCNNKDCSLGATCDGTYFDRDKCTITCYVSAGGHEVTESGSATCSEGEY